MYIYIYIESVYILWYIMARSSITGQPVNSTRNNYVNSQSRLSCPQLWTHTTAPGSPPKFTLNPPVNQGAGLIVSSRRISPDVPWEGLQLVEGTNIMYIYIQYIYIYRIILYYIILYIILYYITCNYIVLYYVILEYSTLNTLLYIYIQYYKCHK